MKWDEPRRVFSSTPDPESALIIQSGSLRGVTVGVELQSQTPGHKRLFSNAFLRTRVYVAEIWL